MTQIVGLTAVDPLGRSRTDALDPSASWVETTFAPPLNVHPAPSKPLSLCPGTSVYQLLSPAVRNGWENAWSKQIDVSSVVASVVAACAGSAVRPASNAPSVRARRLKRHFFISYAPSVVCTGSRAISQPHETSGFASPA